MSDTSQGDGWWLAADGKWYAPQPSEPATPAPPQTPMSAALDGAQLPAGVTFSTPWMRLAAYFLEGLLAIVTLGVGWIVWAAIIGGEGQTPAKRILDLRVIDSASMRPAGMGKMFWMRGLVAGFVAAIAIPLTLGVLLFMPFWDRRNQNLWDKISSTYVVTDPRDEWGTTLNPIAA